MRYLIGFLFLIGCGTAPDKSIEDQLPTQPHPTLDKPRIELVSVKGTAHEITMANQAVLLDNIILASDCFYTAILTGKFTETNNLTNQQIFDKFREEPIQINVEFFNGSMWQNYVSRTVGFWYALTPGVVYHNRHYVTNATSEASNILHEVAHMMGFMHNNVYETSVPYQMNDIFFKCASDLWVNK